MRRSTRCSSFNNPSTVAGLFRLRVIAYALGFFVFAPIAAHAVTCGAPNQLLKFVQCTDGDIDPMCRHALTGQQTNIGFLVKDIEEDAVGLVQNAIQNEFGIAGVNLDNSKDSTAENFDLILVVSPYWGFMYPPDSLISEHYLQGHSTYIEALDTPPPNGKKKSSILLGTTSDIIIPNVARLLKVTQSCEPISAWLSYSEISGTQADCDVTTFTTRNAERPGIIAFLELPEFYQNLNHTFSEHSRQVDHITQLADAVNGCLALISGGS